MYSYFLVENYYTIPSGFVIIDKFNSIEEAIICANEEHVLSKGLDPIVWDAGFWDGKKLSNTFGEGHNIWRYEIHRSWVEPEGGN